MAVNKKNDNGLVPVDQAPRFPLNGFDTTGDRIFVKVPPKPEKTKGGIYLPDSQRESRFTSSDNVYKIVKVGPDVLDKRLTIGAYVLAEGMTLLPFKAVDENNEEMFLSAMREHNVVTIFDGEAIDEAKRIADISEKLAL